MTISGGVLVSEWTTTHSETYFRNYLTLMHRFPGREIDDILKDFGINHKDLSTGCITEKIRAKRINDIIS
jgi:hypothetical protein